MDSILQDIKKAVISVASGDEVVKLVTIATDNGCEADRIINEGLIAGMDTMGKMWKEGEAFIPEVARAAEVVRLGMSVIQGELRNYRNTVPLGIAVIGTVEGDVHDVGKSLVRMMLEATRFTMYDLGIDVAPERFVQAAKDREAQMVCMSALLSTTMTQMEHTIRALKDAGLKVKTMVGGSPVTKEYADKIGADVHRCIHLVLGTNLISFANRRCFEEFLLGTFYNSKYITVT